MNKPPRFAYELDPVGSLEDAANIAAREVRIVQLPPEPEPLIFEREGLPVFGDWETVLYALYCPNCRMITRVSTLGQHVRRYDVEPAPYRSQVGSDAAYDFVMMADTLFGNPEKRRQNAKAELWEQRMRAMAERDLKRAGCEHAEKSP